jgi:hypothetical protein
MRRTALLCCCALLALSFACSRDGSEPLAEETATAEPTPEPTPCSLEDATTEAKSAPTDETPRAVANDVRYSADGCPRIVFEFEDNVPGYEISYAEPPFSDCGSGEKAAVETWNASAYLTVRMEPSGAGDPETGEPAYEGPYDIPVDSPTLKHLKRVCDFEAVFEWVVALDAKHPFEVVTFDGPPRLVIDVSQTS